MLVVALDTSTPVLTAGVVEFVDGVDGQSRLLAEHTLTDAFAHAEQLIPLLQRALADAGRTLPEAAAVVVGLGPGPFTGLRVGIASAAALGDALGIPVHGVPSHAALAAGINGDVLVVTDARRREVYVTGYRDGLAVVGPQPVSPAALADLLSDNGFAPTDVVGSGPPLGAELSPTRAPAVPLSLGLVAVADFEAPAVPLIPLYLRRPDATEPSSARKSVLGR